VARIIGIDLGATAATVAVFDHEAGCPVVIPSGPNRSGTPSVLAFYKGKVFVGKAAESRAILSPERCVREFRQHMGEPGRDPASNTLRDANGQPIPHEVQFAGTPHTPQMLTAYLLQDLKRLAEEHLGEPVAGAVITVPAWFTGEPRRATEEACVLAGLDVRCLINEPTAAAIAFGLTTDEEDEDEDEERARMVLVYDLGGGALDVSILEVRGGDLQVLATEGDHLLGGVDFDKAIAEWLMEQIKKEFGTDLGKVAGLPAARLNELRRARAEVLAEAERAKIVLSSSKSVDIILPRLFRTESGDMANVDVTLQRNTFLMLIGRKLKGTIATVDRAIASVRGLDKKDIDDVLLVGGSSKIPKIRDLLEKHIGKPPRADINPEECIALGAALVTLRYDDRDEPLAWVEPLVETDGGSCTTHSLGIGDSLNRLSILIPKNTILPAAAERVFVVADTGVTSVDVPVYQGDLPVADRNTLLASLQPDYLVPLPGERARLKVGFELDGGGILRVSCTDLLTEQRASASMRCSGIERELFDCYLAPCTPPQQAVATPERSELARTLDEMLVRARITLDGLSGDDRTALKAKMDALEAAFESSDPDRLEEAGNELTDLLFDLIL
jgi:molecular chaperone DnaK